ncbi:hypothetical protein B566_EDAN003578 [Ephemera danica]|nr:hypothetical protein B566_EDAN003578 [Ephemera danica]
MASNTPGFNMSRVSGLFNSLLTDSSIIAPAWALDNSSSNAVVVQSTAGQECGITIVPSVPEYLSAVSLGGQLLLALALGATLFIIVLYADTLRHVIRYTPSKTKTPSVCVLSVYPIVALATLCAAIVPRAQLLVEALTQAAFTAAWYQFFCLLLAYCGGESALLAAKPEELTPRVPPLCCFWVCMPRQIEITKRNLRRIRMTILQLPFVQCLLYFALLVAWAEQQTLAAAQQVIYVQPLMFVSIFTGLWGMGMMLRMLAPRVLEGYHLPQKMFVLQFVLILSKLQGLAVRIVGWAGALPCRPPLPPAVFGNLIYNTLIMTEMVILQFIAWRLYKRPLPKSPSAHQDLTDIIAQKLPSISAIVAHGEMSSSRGRQ